MPKPSPYEHGLDKNAANYAPLSPISLIARTAYTYPQQLAVVHGDRRYTWEETYARSRRLASALVRAGIGAGDTVAVMAANTPEMVEAHFGVPMSGGVLNTLNTRLDADAIAFMLGHGEAKVLITDTEFAPTVGAALAKARDKSRWSSTSTTRSDPAARSSGALDYEAFLAGGDPDFDWQPARRRMGGDRAQLHVGHDRQSEGRRLPSSRRVPERAVQHHRLGHAAALGLSVDPADVPLQRLVLCRGRWRPTPAPTSACARSRPSRSSMRSATHKVTHYCGAPIVHAMLINAPAEWKQGITHQVSCLVAAAAPPASVIEGMQRWGSTSRTSTA